MYGYKQMCLSVLMDLVNTSIKKTSNPNCGHEYNISQYYAFLTSFNKTANSN